jgi:hypothetical protein
VREGICEMRNLYSVDFGVDMAMDCAYPPTFSHRKSIKNVETSSPEPIMYV